MSYHARLYPENCTVALSAGEVIGYSMVHTWGSLGWLGPVVVGVEHQGHGLGRALVHWSLQRLDDSGCGTIGLETWPYHVYNVGLYIKEGFLPGPLTVVLAKPVGAVASPFSGERLTRYESLAFLLEDMAELTGQILPGLDYRPMLEALVKCGLGEVLVWYAGRRMVAFAGLRWESYTQIPAPSYATLEMLSVKPGEEHRLEALLAEVESLVAAAGRAALQVQFSSHHYMALRQLVDRLGYRLEKTRLRMYARQQPVPAERIDFSSFAV